MLTLNSLSFLKGSTVLLTGGTGSLSHALIDCLLTQSDIKIIVYSRDEFKQWKMSQDYANSKERIKFMLGDVRDPDRMSRAMRGVHYVIHTAALKHIDIAERNPFEYIQTNVIGAQNVINAAIDNGVRRVVALSTDKAANPVNLYGATKLCSDKLFIAANSLESPATAFSVVRYGNVMGSRGSAIPKFLELWRRGDDIPITDARMTRFWITLDQSAAFVLNALHYTHGGELWVPRIPSLKLVDLIRVIAPKARTYPVGIRPGEKLHETMISEDDGRIALKFHDFFIVPPSFGWWDADWHQGGMECSEGFHYSSDNNDQWLTDEQVVEHLSRMNTPDARAWVAALAEDEQQKWLRSPK